MSKYYQFGQPTNDDKTNVAVNLNNVRPRPSSSLPVSCLYFPSVPLAKRSSTCRRRVLTYYVQEFPGTPSPGQASYRLSVSQLDKQLPAKPILRAMESPERRGIIDATDVGSSDLIKQYPVLNPLSSSPLGTEIPSSPPSESGLSVGSHVGLIGLPKVRSTKSSVLREQANIARMNGGSRSASDPMTAGTSNSKNYANHEASASRTALGLQDGSINTRTNSFTSVRTASRGSARFAPSSSDKAPNIPLQAISSSGSVASSSEVEGEHDFPLTSKRYSIYGYQYFVHPDARRLLMGDEAQSSAAPAGFGDMMGDMMGNIGSASSKNINFNNDGEAEQVADGFEDVIEDAPLAGNDLMGRFDKSPSIQRGNSNNCRAISHGPAHRHSRSNSEHARRIGSIRRKNRQSQLAEERRTAAAAKALYNLNIPRPVTPVSSIPVRNSSLQSPVIAPTVVPPSGTISSRIATIPGEDKSPGYDRQFSTVIPEQLVQTNHEIADMQPATISKGKEIKTSRLLKFARPTASSSARANKAVKGIGASIKTFSRKVGSKIVRRKDDPVGLPISAPYQTMANRNTEQNIRQQMIDEARLAGLLDDIDESIIGLRPNSAAIENPLLGRLEAEEEVIAAEVVRDNAIEQPRLVDGVIAAEVAQDVASERRQSVNEVQVAEFQEAASIHSVNADLPEAANEVQLPASPRPESIHLVQPAAIVVGLPAPGAADVVDAAGVLDRRGNVIPNRRELAHNRGVAEQILDAVGEIGLFEAEAEYPEFTAIMRRTDYELRELIDMGINVTRTNPAAGNIILADATESVNRFVQLRQRRIDLLVARRQCDHEHMLFFNDFYRLVRRRAAENGNPI
jgi:hypothetical protein